MDDDANKREREQNQRIVDLEVRVTRLEKMVTQLAMLRASDVAQAEPVVEAQPREGLMEPVRDTLLHLIDTQIAGYDATLRKMSKKNDADGIATVKACEVHWRAVRDYVAEKLK